MSDGTLHGRFVQAAARSAARVAIDDPGRGTLTYGELDRLTARVRDRLCAMGVEPGDRVGFFLRKSIDSVVTLFGILRAGGTYVPVDPEAPAGRNAFIFADCRVRAVVTEERVAARLEAALVETGHTPPTVVLADGEGPSRWEAALEELEREAPAPPVSDHRADPDDLAYILYTSGSTGKPKGVMLSHRNAATFVDWCSETFEPTEEDRFSSHAPFHFDLSVFDLFVSTKHGACLVLISEKAGKEPVGLAPLIADKGITIWYSAPTTLALLAQYGHLDRYDYSALRHVLFAGEVFPIKHLRNLMEQLPAPRYFNLYGPTETNVCTAYEVLGKVPDERTRPYPIGTTCPPLISRVADDDGRPVTVGVEGELLIRGPGVTRGYWNLPEITAGAFHDDADGTRWYKTGDLVIGDESGCYEFFGRKDRMIKKRGYRIELGEIESCLYQNETLKEIGVVACEDAAGDLQVIAHLGIEDAPKPSIIALKSFCAQRLPLYMVPDRFVFQERLPRTSTGKVDYQKLKQEGC